MYQNPFIQKLLQFTEEFLRTNVDSLGIDRSKQQRILDYACGNGTVARALLKVLPLASFRGVDISNAQVQRYNDEAVKLLGESPDRMIAIQGDLSNSSEVLNGLEWFDFDVVIISVALHHVDNPVEFLKLLRQHVKKGGSLVVLDFLAPVPSDVYSKGRVDEGAKDGDKHKYNLSRRPNVEGMPAFWPGFSVKDIVEDMQAAGCVDVEVKVHPDSIQMPKKMGKWDRMYIAQATVI
ncbi:methyltransferase [Seiridium cupressi]